MIKIMEDAERDAALQVADLMLQRELRQRAAVKIRLSLLF